MIDALGISQAEVVRLRLCLEWYADARNWEWTANGERKNCRQPAMTRAGELGNSWNIGHL